MSLYLHLDLAKFDIINFSELKSGAALSFNEIAAHGDIMVDPKTLWNWREKGTRLLHLCSGGQCLFFKVLLHLLICLRDILHN